MPDLQDCPFLRACRREPVPHTPVWFMRQAGRSLPEYRELRGTGSILDAIHTPDLATEITLQPVRRHGVDAAVLFSDIVVPIQAVGFGVDVVPGTGPVVEEPFAGAADLARLRPLEPEADIPYVIETVRNLVAELEVPLIGFAGAPFTVASYLIEGRPSRTYAKTKAMMLGEPELWAALIDRLADLALGFIRAQVEAGASAVQLFDSWAGRPDPRAVRGPRPARQPEGVRRPRRPGRAPGPLRCGDRRAARPLRRGREPTWSGVDWRVPIDAGWERIGLRQGRAGQPRPRRLPGAVACGRAPRCSACWTRSAVAPATSSTWATACSPRPTRPC